MIDRWCFQYVYSATCWHCDNCKFQLCCAAPQATISQAISATCASAWAKHLSMFMKFVSKDQVQVHFSPTDVVVAQSSPIFPHMVLLNNFLLFWRSHQVCRLPHVTSSDILKTWLCVLCRVAAGCDISMLSLKLLALNVTSHRAPPPQTFCHI